MTAPMTPDGTVPGPPVPSGTNREWALILPTTRPLSLNDRMHWRKKAAATRTVRDAACLLARSAGIPPLDRISVELHYIPPDKRIRDALNLVATLKACEDGVVDAGVVPGDDARYVVPIMPVLDPPDSKAIKRLYVIVREVTDV